MQVTTKIPSISLTSRPTSLARALLQKKSPLDTFSVAVSCPLQSLLAHGRGSSIITEPLRIDHPIQTGPGLLTWRLSGPAQGSTMAGSPVSLCSVRPLWRAKHRCDLGCTSPVLLLSWQLPVSSILFFEGISEICPQVVG